MTYTAKPLSCDPTKLRGLSEKLILSHWENNYGGAVRRLNAIAAQLTELDFARAPVFVINGLKREELIATNSMILHELYFDGLGGDGISGGAIDEALKRDFGSVDRWRAEFIGTGKALRGGSGWVLLSYSHRDGRLMNQWAAITRTRWRAERRSSRSTCTSTPISSTTAPPRSVTSTRSWRTSTGHTSHGFTRLIRPASLNRSFRFGGPSDDHARADRRGAEHAQTLKCWLAGAEPRGALSWVHSLFPAHLGRRKGLSHRPSRQRRPHVEHAVPAGPVWVSDRTRDSLLQRAHFRRELSQSLSVQR